LESNTVADFSIGSPTGAISIYSARSHSSNRLLAAVNGLSNSPFSILISGSATSGIGGLNADGQVVQIGSTAVGGPAGPVTLIGNSFYWNEIGVQAKIGYAMTQGSITSIGNLYNNLLPFARNSLSGTLHAHVSVHGDRGYDASTGQYQNIWYHTIWGSGDGQTPDASGVENVSVSYGAGVPTFTNFLNGRPFQRLTLYINTATVNFTHGNGVLFLSGATTATLHAGDTISFIFMSNAWREVSRSHNH
jgi:hypothetical protein